MLYTRKGDGGTTKILNCDQRLSKSSAIAAALGSLDEINSLLGLCKIKSGEKGLTFGPEQHQVFEVVSALQHNLFIVQAELAGADKTITENKVKGVETIIDTIEQELPPIKSFFVSGGTELAALFDFARTVSRRAERSVVAAMVEEQDKPDGRKLGVHTLAFLNRLSSVLYALARLSNAKSGITEEPPSYN